MNRYCDFYQEVFSTAMTKVIYDIYSAFHKTWYFDMIMYCDTIVN